MVLFVGIYILDIILTKKLLFQGFKDGRFFFLDTNRPQKSVKINIYRNARLFL